MKQYLEVLDYCFKEGLDIDSRAGKVRKAFGNQMRFDLSKSFPIITTKKIMEGKGLEKLNLEKMKF